MVKAYLAESKNKTRLKLFEHENNCLDSYNPKLRTENLCNVANQI